MKPSGTNGKSPKKKPPAEAPPSAREIELAPGLKVAMVPLARLHQRRQNYRAMTSQQYKALQASLGKYGFKSMIAVQPKPGEAGMYEVLDGHHRWQAAKDAKVTELPAIVLEGLDPDDADLAMLSFNVQAEVKPDVYLAFLNEMSGKVGLDALAEFTALDRDLLGELQGVKDPTVIPMMDLGFDPEVPESVGPTDNYQRGSSIQLTLPGRPAIRAQLDKAQKLYNTLDHADAVLALLEDRFPTRKRASATANGEELPSL